MEEPLMNLRPKTPYEKLLWERARNLELRERLNQSELEREQRDKEFAEYVESIKNNTVTVLTRKNKKLKYKNLILSSKVTKLKKDIEELMQSLVKLQTTGSLGRSINDSTGENSGSGDPADL